MDAAEILDDAANENNNVAETFGDAAENFSDAANIKSDVAETFSDVADKKSDVENNFFYITFCNGYSNSPEIERVLFRIFRSVRMIYTLQPTALHDAKDTISIPKN